MHSDALAARGRVEYCRGRFSSCTQQTQTSDKTLHILPMVMVMMTTCMAAWQVTSLWTTLQGTSCPGSHGKTYVVYTTRHRIDSDRTTGRCPTKATRPPSSSPFPTRGNKDTQVVACHAVPLYDTPVTPVCHALRYGTPATPVFCTIQPVPYRTVTVPRSAGRFPCPRFDHTSCTSAGCACQTTPHTHCCSFQPLPICHNWWPRATMAAWGRPKLCAACVTVQSQQEP
jgi:hypothetical protein